MARSTKEIQARRKNPLRHDRKILKKEGTLVTLKAKLEEGWPEQKGRLCDDLREGDDSTVVRLLPRYWDEDEDDGLRQVGVDQIAGARPR
jgi:hypothetical protein